MDILSPSKGRDTPRDPVPRTGVSAVFVRAVEGESVQERPDWVAVEEPLEIRAGGPNQPPIALSVTMRTPGHDHELAVGFLYTEGLIRGDDLDAVAMLHATQADCNVVRIRTKGPFDGSSLSRNFLSTSSCGVCGKSSLNQIAVRCPTIAPGLVVNPATVTSLPGTLRAAQQDFDRTGGLHAAGLFDADGRLLALREDVGRHNAVDKLVGWAVLAGQVPLSGRILMVSGRTSFEILQKAAVGGVPIVCAVSAPSSLAISIADRLGITLIGFLRGTRFNIYTHPERIELPG